MYFAQRRREERKAQSQNKDTTLNFHGKVLDSVAREWQKQLAIIILRN